MASQRIRSARRQSAVVVRRCGSTITGAAAVVVIAACTLLSAAPSTPALAAGPSPPIAMADMFLVEQDGNWFCNGGPRQLNNAACSKETTSAQAVAELLDSLPSNPGSLFLKVGKARNDCANGQEPVPGRVAAGCSTAVPAPRTCPDDSTPYCRLKALVAKKIKLGIVIGGEAEKAPRTASDLIWHACKIGNADTEGLYGFVWLDEVRQFDGPSLRSAVRRIQARQYADGTACDPGRADRPPWKVITNDTTWRPGGPITLRTGAWAHARHLGLLARNPKRIAQALAGGIDRVLTPTDVAFVNTVNRGPQRSRAVLRLEVPSQSSRFAAMSRGRQCKLPTRWAVLQRTHRYTLIHPLYIHGARPELADWKENPYDSFAEDTFGLQKALIERPRTRGLPSCGSDEQSSPDRSSDTEDDNAPDAEPSLDDARYNEPAPVPPPPTPALRAPGVGSGDASAVSCISARLHGWVNPHGSATSFTFELWKRGGDATRQTGGGNVGPVNNREHVSRVADGLQRDTGYTGRLIAVNAAGRSVSEIFSFTTRARC